MEIYYIEDLTLTNFIAYMYDMDTSFGLNNQGNKFTHQGISSTNYYSRSIGYLSELDATARNTYYDIAVDYDKLKEKVVEKILNEDEDTLGIVLNCLRGYLEKFIEEPEKLLNEKFTDRLDYLTSDIAILCDRINCLEDRINNLETDEVKDICSIQQELYNIKTRLNSITASI